MRKIAAIILTLFLVSSPHAQASPGIIPDIDGVTVPVNIAPLHFRVADAPRKCVAVFSAGDKEVRVKARRGGLVAIRPKSWHKLAEMAAGASVKVRVSVRERGEWREAASIEIYVSGDRIDPFLAYRLIEPGYEVWNNLGIYQRDLESFREKPVITNDKADGACMNCHSFCNRDPDRFLFHMRARLGGTYLCSDGQVEKLNTKTDQTISALVYPSWHPSGRFVAFSVNDTKQSFHTTDPNRIEVFDRASDVVVYDVEKHEIISCPLMASEKYFETFPTFSPDGRTLYFCSAQSRRMPEEYDKVVYNLCSIEFNPETCTFGDRIKTLYKGRSVSFPRVSPDGKYLLATLASYGNFSIWHKDADLAMFDLSDGSMKPLDAVNSADVESYHSWSSDSRWVVFSSRRGDGLYTRLYIAHIDEDGLASKPFLLPQNDPSFYDSFMKSYNIPELVSGPVTVSQGRISRCAHDDEGVDLSFRMVAPVQ